MNLRVCRFARADCLLRAPCAAQAERGEAVLRRGGAGEDALEISEAELAGWTPKQAAP